MKIKGALSKFAIANRSLGPGIINVRSYNSIWDVSANFPTKIFISYTPISEWDGHVPTVENNDFTRKMIVNIHFEDMNKPQLHRLTIRSTDCYRVDVNPSRMCITI